MFRDTKKAFSQDAKAQTLSKYTIDSNYFDEFTKKIYISVRRLKYEKILDQL